MLKVTIKTIYLLVVRVTAGVHVNCLNFGNFIIMLVKKISVPHFEIALKTTTIITKKVLKYNHADSHFREYYKRI